MLPFADLGSILNSVPGPLALLGIGDPTIRLALEALKRDGKVAAEGTGRSAVWRTSRSL